MSTVMIIPYKRKKKTTYQVYYKNFLGKKVYFNTYRLRKDAQEVATSLRSALDNDTPPKKDKNKVNLIKFEEVSDSLMQIWSRRVKEETLSKASYYNYFYWLGVLNRVFGGKLLCQITQSEIKEFLHDQVVKNSVISSNRYLEVIKAVFNHGKFLKALIINPAEEIKKLSEKNHERKRFLLPDELNRLIDASQKNRGKFYVPAAIYLGAEHAASKQEILSLKWSDINFDYEEIGLINFFRTKNKRTRVEYLMPRTKESFLVWRDHLEMKRRKASIKNSISDQVFCRIDGTPIKRFDKSWKACLKEAGIKDFRFHDLRHTFASNLLMSGASLKDVKEMIGHSDISMTDRYSHLTLHHKLQKQIALADHYQPNGEK